MSTRSVSRSISRNFGAPSAKSSVAVARCDSSQAVSSSIAPAAAAVASVEFTLQLLVGELREDRRHLVAEERGVAAEARHAALDEGLGQWRAQIGADVGGEPGDGARVAEKSLAAVSAAARIRASGTSTDRAFRGTRPDCETAPRRSPARRTARLDHPLEILTFESLRRRVSVAGSNFARSRLELAQLGDVGLDRRAAPVRHLAVEFVSPGLHGEIRVGLEARLDEANRRMPASPALRVARVLRTGAVLVSRLRTSRVCMRASQRGRE